MEIVKMNQKANQKGFLKSSDIFEVHQKIWKLRLPFWTLTFETTLTALEIGSYDFQLKVWKILIFEPQEKVSKLMILYYELWLIRAHPNDSINKLEFSFKNA